MPAAESNRAELAGLCWLEPGMIAEPAIVERIKAVRPAHPNDSFIHVRILGLGDSAGRRHDPIAAHHVGAEDAMALLRRIEIELWESLVEARYGAEGLRRYRAARAESEDRDAR